MRSGTAASISASRSSARQSLTIVDIWTDSPRSTRMTVARLTPAEAPQLLLADVAREAQALQAVAQLAEDGFVGVEFGEMHQSCNVRSLNSSLLLQVSDIADA